MQWNVIGSLELALCIWEDHAAGHFRRARNQKKDTAAIMSMCGPDVNVSTEQTRYLIVGPTRSGTTALHLLLGGHPQVSTLVGELAFKRLADGLSGFTLKGYVTEQEQQIGRRLVFDAITSAHRTSATTTLGAKATINSAAGASDLVKVVGTYMPFLKIIVMVRRDLVAHFYSRAQLRKTGVAHSWRRPADGKGEVSGRVDKWLLANSAITTLAMYRRLQAARGCADYVEVEYETFAGDNLGTYRLLLDFLGLEYVEPTWHHSSKLHDNPEDVIPGYADLTRYVASLAERQNQDLLSPHFVRWLRLYARFRRLINPAPQKPVRS